MIARWIACFSLCVGCLTFGKAAEVYPVAVFPPLVSSSSPVKGASVPFEIDFPLKGVLLANIPVEGDIHCVITPVKDQIVRIEFSAPSLSVNNRVFRNVKGELVITKENVLVRRVEVENLLLSGKIDIARNELVLDGDLRATAIENVFTLFGAKPALIGKTVGKIKISGPFDELAYKGYILTENGMLKGISFSESLFHFSGAYPFCFIDDSYVKIDGVKYSIEGTLSVRELADLDKVTMTILPERLVIDGWNITQRGLNDSKDNVVFSKKGGSNFKIDFNERGDVTHDRTHMGVEFKKTLAADNFLRFNVNDSKSTLVVGKEVEF